MSEQHPVDREQLRRERWELLAHINALTDRPMTALAFVWLALLVLELTRGIGPLLQGLTYLIWGLFVADFIIEFLIAPHKRGYLQRNWLTALSLLLPAFRVLRIFRTVRLLQAARAWRSVGLLRLVTSLNRGMRALVLTLGGRGVSYVVVLTVIVTLSGAAGMAFFENPAALREANITGAEAPGVGLDDYGEALWWTAMILTTLGSDYWPRTVEGRVLGWLLSLYALAVFGYITAAIASYFVGKAPPPAPPPPPDTELRTLRAEVVALRLQVEGLLARLDGQAAPAPPRGAPLAAAAPPPDPEARAP